MSFAFKSKLKEEPLDEKEYWKNRCNDLEQELDYVKFKYSQSLKDIDKLMGVVDFVIEESE